MLALLIKGAFGSRIGVSYTLYYATTFVFTGLAVAVAFHGGLFNIGGEGQAMLGGLGTALVALWLGRQLPALDRAAADGAGGGGVRHGLGRGAGGAAGLARQPRGDHHHHVQLHRVGAAGRTCCVNVLKEPGNMTVESRAFGPGAHVPGVHEVLAAIGIEWPRSPLNLSVLLAALAAVVVYLLLWRSRPGYALRAVGLAPEAARYAGIRPRAQVMFSMALSGALAGLVGINEIAGVHGRLLLDYVVGAGFAGIAVSLIGRNHPVGIVLASLLFGALYQGGSELAFEIQGFSRDMVFTLQGLIVLFSGAMAQVAAPTLARLCTSRWRRAPRAESAHG